DYFSLRTVTPLGAGTEVATRRLSGEAQRLVREFVAREHALRPEDRARVAKQLASRLRAYALEADPAMDDAEFLRALPRALRAARPAAPSCSSSGTHRRRGRGRGSRAG